MMLMICGIDPLGLAQHVDAAHLGHPDVGDQHVDPLALQRLDRHLAVGGEQHVVAVAPQHDRQQLAHRPLVVHDQHARHRRRRRSRSPNLEPEYRSTWLYLTAAPGRRRESHQHGRARTLGRIDLHFTGVVADDPVHHRQPQPGPALEAAAERLENSFQLLGRNADALVGHADRHVRRLVGRRRDRQRQRAAVRHRPQPVGRQVPDDLADLPFVGLEHHRLGRHVDRDPVRLGSARRCSAAASRYR